MRTAVRAAKAPPPSLQAPTSFDLVFPVGYGISRVAIGASQDVTFGPSDQVLAIGGTPGTVTNAGSGPIAAGPGTSAGNIVSTGNIVLQPNVSATSAQSAGTVTLHPGDAVGTITQQAVLTPLAHRTVNVPPLAGTPAEFEAVPGSSSLAPGLYDQVTIPAGATVTLSAGNYVMNSFTLSANGQITLDTSLGTVNVFVTSAAVWNGQVAGDGTRFVFSYLGAKTLKLAGPFTGTALVPNATLALGPHPSSYSGVFYGQEVSVSPGVTVQQIATPLLAASVTVSKTTLCMGEATEVQLDASDAGPNATTRINGIPGSHEFVQFDGLPGNRLIVASVVTADGRADFTEVPIVVEQCTPTTGTLPPIALHFWPTPNQLNEVEFMVHDFDANGVEVLPSGPASYAWSFGDGQTATTTSPLVSHDYTSSVNPLLPFTYFTASVTVSTSGGSTSAQKVVPIWSVYAANRAKGVVQPPSSTTPSGDNLAVNVTNYETTPLSITAARVDLLPCDPALDPVQQASLPLSVTVPASSTSTVTIPQPDAFSPSICAIGTHLMGSASAGKVYSDSYARVKENGLTKQAVTDPTSIAILNQASAYTADPNHFDFRDLRQLQAQGILTQLPAPVTAGATYANPGDECTPGDTQAGLVCQPTADWVVVPGELLNAFKGDLVVHHACGDMIANLLASIGQNYSHSMTISKNRVEIRHSTASESRMTGSINLMTEQLDPQKVQFGFPGTDGLMPYTVDQMVNGYCVPDPDGASGDSACPNGWQITGSLHPNPSQCSADLPVVYPLVIRPPPDATTAELQAVTPVGDQALAISGHYRFFMYSRADEFAPATSGPSWAIGTEESVCSLFDLESTRHAGSGGSALPLAGGGLNDGMRVYTVDERTTAGNNLYAQVYNQVEGQLPSGWATLLSFLTGGLTQAFLDGLANNVANQICNCFANDGCADSTGTWNNITSGIAVAPDDIVNVWQPPPSGTYGYNEPLVYAPTAFRHKYAWATKSGDASMTVVVVDGDNNPFPSATVVLNSTPVGTTDSTGTLQIASLDQGSYDVEAQAFLTPPPPPSPPPPPPTLSPSAILALPACVAAPLSGFSSPCSVTGNDPTCPNLWTSECVLGSTSGYASTCACFAPPTPLKTCDLALADRSATVPSSGNVTVELTLCTKCSGGVPQSCTQHCASNADCDSPQICNSSGDCAAPPRIVNIQASSDSTFKVEVDNALVGYQNGTAPFSLSMTCDPNATSSGGTSTQTVCETATGTAGPCPACITESTSDQETITVQCQEDETTGGIAITVSTALAEANDCGSTGTVRTTGSYTTAIAPAGPSDPTPGASVSFDDCYVQPPESIFQGACDANDAHVTLNFTSVPAP